MASYDTWYNLLKGLSRGAFDVLEVRDGNGVMRNILTLVGSGGSGGSGGVSDVQASAPLSASTIGTVRTLSINLGAYSTSVQVTAAINSALTSYVTQTALATALVPYFTGTQVALILTAYDSRIAAATATTAALAPYSTTVAAATATTAAG